MMETLIIIKSFHKTYSHPVRYVGNIPTKQFWTTIFRNTQSEYYASSLTEDAWEFQNNALWDTHSLLKNVTTIYKNGWYKS